MQKRAYYCAQCQPSVPIGHMVLMSEGSVEGDPLGDAIAKANRRDQAGVKPMHSLWRGGVEIGRITQPGNPENPQAGMGMLEPNGAFAIARSMSQTQLSIIPGTPIIQEEIRDHVVGSDGLEESSAAEPDRSSRNMNVPPDLVLELRAEDGSVIEADIIMLQRLVVAPGAERTAPPKVRSGNSWMVTYLRMF